MTSNASANHPVCLLLECVPAGKLGVCSAVFKQNQYTAFCFALRETGIV